MPRGTANAGIDLALWDILGKVHGVPCHKLSGGPVRDSIRLYCHLGGGDLETFYETPVDNAARFAEMAQRAVADAHRIALAPHNPQGPVSTAASLEFGFSQPSYIICESVHNDVPWREDVVEEGYVVDKTTRTVQPNTKPGLGVTINEDEVRKHLFEQEIPQRVFYRDGSVGDW